MRTITALAAFLMSCAVPFSPAFADDFNVSYHVERIESSKLSLDRCAEIAQKEAEDFGFIHGQNKTPEKLIVVSGGVPHGGASFMVYCIAVDDKTTYVVQGIDYQPQKNRAGKLADIINNALIAASR